MKIEDYIELVTSNSNNASLGLPFAVLGLVEEIGEVADKLIAGASQSTILDEVGDVCYYVVLIALNSRIDPATLTIGLPNSFVASSRQLTIDTMLAGATLAGFVKKDLRDRNGYITPLRKLQIQDSLEDVLHFLSEICKMHEVTLAQARESNASKILRRSIHSYDLIPSISKVLQ